MRGRAFAAHGKKAGVLARKFELPLDQLPVFWSPRAAKRQHDLEQIVTALRKPCGIFAANDVIACFVLQAAREKGYRVPEDIGVLGVDDDPVPNAAAGLSISSIHPPFREVGLRAAELLGDLLKGAKNCSHVRIAPVRVVVRTSTDVFVTNDPLLSKAQRYIEERRQGRILVGELTRALGTNAVTLGKHFQRTLDVGIREYIEKRRLEYATVQLRLGKMNVDEVTDACGFSSASYFSRVYKRVTGNSPGRVRGRTS
jgi:LacI family transcriptional regulator